ncbi:DNA internalization-related competence protein ComEC/Rec2 [Enterococcus larvae]|uniref:DNA internalization-related competence protein ComEC/Rec2 n=1 Tax=Enterococcus larvae TaxID=2794352 RepID=UPI003F2AE744
MRTHLLELSNVWIFPTAFAVAVNCLILHMNSITVIFCLFTLIRLLRTGNRRVITSGFLFIFFLLPFLLTLYLREEQEVESSGPISEAKLQIQADKIHVNGDVLQLEGTVHSNGLKQRVRAFYQLSTEQEQQEWKHRDSTLMAVISGTLDRPLPRMNLNGFDYRETLSIKRINQILTIEKIHKLKPENSPLYDIPAQLTLIRKRLLLYCEQRFSDTTVTYSQILLFGERSNDAELTDTFNHLGILHLFSLSGMHVLFFLQLFRFTALRLGVSLEQYFWLQLLISFAFAGLTGFSISVLRALLQNNLSAVGRKFQLTWSPLDVWSLTIFFAIVLDPYTLFSLAGQYSYFLSFFIMFIRPPLNRIHQPIVQTFCFSAVLSLLTLPLVAVTTHEWQPIGIFLTFLLVPFFEKILLPALTIIFISSFLIYTSPIEPLFEYALRYLTSCFHFLGEVNHFSVVTGQIPVWLFLAELLLIFLIVNDLAVNWKRSVLLLGFLLLFAGQKYVLQLGIIAYIDVGQGDSILIHAPFHQEAILIDTGGKLMFSKEEWKVRQNQKTNAEYTVIPFLKSRGIKKLDKVFITHSDTDHMGDLLSISEKIFITAVYFPEGAELDSQFRAVIQQLSEKGTSFYRLLAGQKIDSFFQLNVLAPSTAGKGENNDSLVLHTEIAAAHFLFTGDLEAEGEAELIRKYPKLPVDILKVGHHGSRTSSSKTFIETVEPTQAIISCGRNNRFGHPHEDIIQTLEENDVEIFRTDQEGMIYYEWSPFLPISDVKTILDSD